MNIRQELAVILGVVIVAILLILAFPALAAL